MTHLLHLEEYLPHSIGVYSNTLLQLYVDRSGLLTISNAAWYATVISAFLLDVVSTLVTLVPYLDSGLLHALKLIGQSGNQRFGQYFCANLLFAAILYTLLPVALLINRLTVWESLQSWNLVGIVIQLSSIPYSMSLDVFALTARIALAFCFKASIADLTFPDDNVPQPMNTPGQVGTTTKKN
ncbi:putative integral membrane protein [Babesia bovis T2Bo]|nr:putative integral membrane protein [Babesia bovis T2Bo]EDO06703.2 putative integral membrane protein [Babesia bovis T2Bo]